MGPSIQEMLRKAFFPYMNGRSENLTRVPEPTFFPKKMFRSAFQFIWSLLGVPSSETFGGLVCDSRDTSVLRVKLLDEV